MKKPLAVVLLVVGGLVGIFGLSILNLALFFLIWGPGVFIAIAATLAAAFGIDCLRRLYKRKYELKTARFLVCAYVPSVLCAAIAYITVLKLDEAGYFTGFLAGLGEFMITFSYLITAGAALAAAFVWLAVLRIINKRRKESGNESKN